MKKLKAAISLNGVKSLQFYQLLRYLTQLFVSVLLARLIKDRQIIGQYETVVMVTGAATFFWVTGIISALIPQFRAAVEKERRAIVGASFFNLMSLTVLAIVVLLALRPLIYHGKEQYYYYYLGFLLFNTPAFLNEYVMLLTGKFKDLIVYSIVTLLVTTGAFGIPLLLGYSLETALICLVLAGLIKFVWLIFLLLSGHLLMIERQKAVEFFSKASPLFIGLLLGGSMQYIDSITIRLFYSASDFAIFQYGSYELPIVMLMANALSNVYSGEVASSLSENKLPQTLSELKSKSLRLMHFFFPTTIVLMFCSHMLYRTVYTESFERSAVIFNVYLLLIISRLVFPQTLLLGLKENKLIFRVSGIEWTINLVLNFVFIYIFGMMGVAFATFVAFLTEKLIQIRWLKKRGFKTSSYIPVGHWIGYSILTVVAFGMAFLIRA